MTYAPQRTPGELPPGLDLAVDGGPCDTCGAYGPLEPGEVDVCAPCHVLGRAAALRRRPRNPVDARRTSEGTGSAAIASPAGAGEARAARQASGTAGLDPAGGGG